MAEQAGWKYDVVIPGGGHAGTGAAIATRAAGLSVGFALKHAITTSQLASMVYGFPTSPPNML